MCDLVRRSLGSHRGSSALPLAASCPRLVWLWEVSPPAIPHTQAVSRRHTGCLHLEECHLGQDAEALALQSPREEPPDTQARPAPPPTPLATPGSERWLVHKGPKEKLICGYPALIIPRRRECSNPFLLQSVFSYCLIIKNMYFPEGKETQIHLFLLKSSFSLKTETQDPGGERALSVLCTLDSWAAPPQAALPCMRSGSLLNTVRIT